MSASVEQFAAVTPPSVLTHLADMAVRFARGAAAVVAFFAIWECLPRLALVNRTFLPPFSTVVNALIEMLQSGELGDHLSASAGRASLGLILAGAVGVPLGLVIGWYRGVADMLNPLLELFRNTAPLALLPVFVLMLGMGEVSKVAMVFYACLWPILLNTVSGVRSVDPLLIRSARSMALTQTRLFAHVVVPASLPSIFTGIRIASAYSILVLIAAEMVGAKAGLGYLVNYAQFTFEIPKMYAGIVTLSVLGLVLNQGLVLVERRLTAWKTEV